MSVRLWAPNSPLELYLERGGVHRLRPLFQGDIFRDVLGPGLPLDPDGENLAMLTSHPCAMVTSGAQYVSSVEAVRVRRFKQIRLEDWHRLAFDVLPLPDLVENSGEHWAAVFTERGHVPMPSGRLDDRVAALSLQGVLALQQRLVHWTSRVAISDERLEAATKPVWLENELQESWNEKFIGEDAEGPDLVAALSTEARAFDAELRKVRKLKDEGSDYTVRLVLQQELRDPEMQDRVRVAMGIVRKRRGKPTAAGK